MASLALVAVPLGLLLLFQRPAAREALLGVALLGLSAWIAAGDTSSLGRFCGAWICLLGGAAAASGYCPYPLM